MIGRYLREKLQEDESHEVIMVVVLMVLFFAVLGVTFVYMVSQLQHREASAPQEQSTVFGDTLADPAAAAVPTSGADQPTVAPKPSPVGLPAAGSPLPTPGEGHRWREYQEPVTGLSLQVPDHWQHALLRREDSPAPVADIDVVFEDTASAARLAVSAWDASQLASFTSWASTTARGMQSVDGRLPVNALVAGREALVTWAPESATTPATYAAFLEREGIFYRVAYTAADGGGAIGDFIRALVTLEWDEAQTVDTVPPLPVPTGRYFPSDLLFESAR